METVLPLLKKLILATLLLAALDSRAQKSLKSILINHGSTACSNTEAEQQMFTGMLSGSPSLLFTGNNGVPFYNAFTAYNPKDRKIYFADISDGNSTKLYAMDYNFSGELSSVVASAPTYVYSYGISQLCFDQDGNNLVIYNYDASSAKGHLKRMDLVTGDDIPGTNKIIDFPADNAPNSLAWGDMVFMPNGRVFMTFGNTPSKLFELINFNDPGHATAMFLTDIPHPCFSIGYVDGNLLVAGSDGSGCYYYTWDINTKLLSNSQPFPMGKSTADITHMNVGVGASEELIGGSVVNANTADIIYHVVVKNKGNIDIGNVQLNNKLTDAFGAGNISNVHISFVSNPAGLLLNPLYDGELVTDMLLPGQSIPNFPVSQDSAVIRIQLRATNLIPNTTYYSSSITSGQAGAGLNQLNVIDSSNNGTAAMIDVDANGMSDDLNEGIPTPFMYNVLLPVSQISFTASLRDQQVLLIWKNTNEINLKNYTVERSTDGINYTALAIFTAKNTSQPVYQASDNTATTASSKIFYRLKINDNQGKFYYSNTSIIQLKNSGAAVGIYPNPFVGQVTVRAESTVSTPVSISLYDGTGKLVKHRDYTLQAGINFMTVDNLEALSKGVYYLELVTGNKKTQTKIIK